MKRFLTIIPLLIVGVFAYSQQVLSFTEDTFWISKDASTRYELVAEGNTYNDSNDSITILWERVVNQYDLSWQGTQVCDGQQCYPIGFDVPPVPDKIAPNSTGNMDVHFINDFLPGEGVAHVKAWIEGDTTTAVTAVFMGFGIGSVSSPVLTGQVNVRIYPNPANDFIMVKNLPGNQVANVEVYNILGKRMLAYNANTLHGNNAPQRFDISDLPKGIYMVRIYDQFMNVVTTKSISKE